MRSKPQAGGNVPFARMTDYKPRDGQPPDRRFNVLENLRCDLRPIVAREPETRNDAGAWPVIQSSTRLISLPIDERDTAF